MNLLYAYHENFHVYMENFEQLILWIAILCVFGTIICHAYLSLLSKNFFYELKVDDIKISRNFSIIDLQLPYKKSLFTEILINVNSKTEKLVEKSLKIDSYFMPFAYGSIFFLTVFLFLKFKNPELANHSQMSMILKCSFLLPLISYVADILENHVTYKLIRKISILKQEKINNKDVEQKNSYKKKKLILRSRLKIFFFAAVKWLSVIYSITLILLTTGYLIKLYFM
ncbi:hypothetical protein ACI513_03960 [Chryseobacterium sp. M5]|uniref:hypothetical protein n=1 Tax=Chryseobacterium sp. M5 TaxID=3379128 RepID=UPI0038571D71